MAITVVCACGKRFSARDEYEGRRAICPACKREFIFQAAGIPVFDEAVEMPPPVPPILTDQDNDRCQPDPKPEDPLARPFWKDPIVVIGAAVPSAILSVFFGYLYHEHRTKEHHRHVYQLKVVVDSLVKSNQPRAALEKCDEILDVIGDPAIADVKMRGYADMARKTKDRLRLAMQAEVKREESARQAKADADRRAEANRLAAKARADIVPAEEMPDAARIFIMLYVDSAIRSVQGIGDFKVSGLEVQAVPDDPRKLSWIWKATMTIAIAAKPRESNRIPEKGSSTWTILFRYAPDGRNSGEFWREVTDLRSGEKSRVDFPLSEFLPSFRKTVMDRWLIEFKQHEAYVASAQPDREAKLSDLYEHKIDTAGFFRITLDELQEILESTEE
jgi:hypothetical protein